jgi:NADPH:quinone reductase-like Zn-dependent oxidoreductase
MKAVVLREAGSADALQVREVEKPIAADNEVLIKVSAISINPAEYKIRSRKDLFQQIYGGQKDVILGWDVSGTIEEMGTDVTGFAVGDEVFGMINFPLKKGGYAEYVAVNPQAIVRKPAGITHAEAAGATLAALTAYQDLMHHAKIKKGDRVLIHAASGGVGHYAVQIAKNRGAYVIGTSSGANKEMVLNLGADEHIDYNTTAFEEVLRDIDVVLDTLGGEITGRSLKVVKTHGHLLSITGDPISQHDLAEAEKRQVNLRTETVNTSSADLQVIAELLSGGQLKTHVSRTFPLDQIAEAHRLLESGRAVGKIIVII